MSYVVFSHCQALEDYYMVKAMRERGFIVRDMCRADIAMLKLEAPLL
jgi:hypothetical protein